MTKVALGKTFEFAASHRLWRNEWSAEENLKFFGKCANPAGHGHNYRVEVSVEGTPNAESGMTFDAALLTKIFEQQVMSVLDHKNLNVDVPWFQDKQSSIENVTLFIWNILENALRDESVELSEIKIWETGRIFAVKRRGM